MTLPAGWLTDDEAKELERLATDRTVLELGAWKGRSTIVMSRVARYVVSVDRHEGIPPSHPEDSLPEYLSSVRGTPNVAIVIADFRDMVRLLRNIDMVYVDGDHDSHAVTCDTTSALTVQPTVVAYHDWDYDDVRKTATRLLGRDPDNVVGSVASYVL
jgi:predicted O-methyltransferase YrrM